jgi:hypothetical protein
MTKNLSSGEITVFNISSIQINQGANTNMLIRYVT